MPSWLTGLTTGAGGFGVLWVFVALYRTWISKRTTDVDALDQMARTAAEMVANAAAEIQRVRLDAENRIRATELQAANQISMAMRDVDMARREATEARQAAQQAERAALAWYRQMTDEAYRPTATVDRWRELVTSLPPNVGVNGSAIH